MAKQIMDMGIFANMQEGSPYRTYQKTLPSKVFVIVLNVFSGEPESVLLYGQPGGEDSIVRVWSVQEDIFFKRMNRRLLDQGLVIEVKEQKAKEESVDKPLEQLSDEDLIEKVISRPFKFIESTLNKTESEALVARLLSLARTEEKSEKLIHLIESRLVEIQSIKLKE